MFFKSRPPYLFGSIGLKPGKGSVAVGAVPLLRMEESLPSSDIPTVGAWGALPLPEGLVISPTLESLPSFAGVKALAFSALSKKADLWVVWSAMLACSAVFAGCAAEED
jgi:hypothetical protein